jgi:hypothetical protein
MSNGMACSCSNEECRLNGCIAIKNIQQSKAVGYGAIGTSPDFIKPNTVTISREVLLELINAHESMVRDEYTGTKFLNSKLAICFKANAFIEAGQK